MMPQISYTNHTLSYIFSCIADTLTPSASHLPKIGPAVWAIDEHRVFTRCPPPENPLPTARASIEHRLRKPWTGAVAPDNWIRGRE